MLLFKLHSEFMAYLEQQKAIGLSIGFVPTMGALHDGHISLVKKCVAECDICVASIFVNPAQFNDAKDLAHYPRPVERDLDLLITAGCNVLYMPESEDVYWAETQKSSFDFGGLDIQLEGASRPGHFAGVAWVVEILLGYVNPDILYLGQKDYQQVLIIRKLCALKFPRIQIEVCPIIREENGLAMSSRNERLTPEKRQAAAVIYQALKDAAAKFEHLSFNEIEKTAVEEIEKCEGFKVDYFKILNAGNLMQPDNNDKDRNLIIVTAVLVDGIRLLDNLELKHYYETGF